VGEVLKEDGVAFVIADLSVVWVNVTVYARDLARVHVGQPVWVQPEGVAERAEGTISFVQPIVGEQTRSANARVVLQNAGGKLRPGLFVTAEVGVEQVELAVAISEQALQRLDGKDAVFVQEGDAFEARPVKLGRKGKAPDGNPVVEVLGGIAPGDRYVGKNSFLLKAELGKSEAAHEH
jgi:cobalt-zinc-cadmium efflux system membrane fusion protein